MGARARGAGRQTGGPRRVLVLSADVLPFPGLPTTGAGLRAWGIGHGLRSAGHDVSLVMPRHMLEALNVAEETKEAVRAHTFTTPANALATWRPEVVVVQHWWLATLFEARDVPLAIDLHGPNLLETLYQNHPEYEDLIAKKVVALSRADFITCAGPSQRHYFDSWLQVAGWTEAERRMLAVIPVSLAPEAPEHAAVGETSFVYGGMYLPWQNPLMALDTLVKVLDRRRRGRLHLFGGPHPVLKLAAAEMEAIEQRLAASERVVAHGLVSRDALLAAYRAAHVAFDVMPRNPERELAFTTRTAEYLWCGLPVVYNDYADLAALIDEYEAGWTVDPENPAAITAAVEEILDAPAEVVRRGDNARRLAHERLNWEKTIGPLDAFCRLPSKRRGSPPLLAAVHGRPGPPRLSTANELLFDQLAALLSQQHVSRTTLAARLARRGLSRLLPHVTEPSRD